MNNYETHEGRIKIVEDCLNDPITANGPSILDALSSYRGGFHYKCTNTDKRCPLRRDDSGYNKHGYPGFPSKDQLEEHWVQDHVMHDSFVCSTNWTGTLIHYTCRCGHVDDMAYDSKEKIPQGRIDHLRLVEDYHTIKGEQ